MLLGLSRSWSWAGYGLTCLLLLPLLAIFAQALVPESSVFPHLVDSVLPTYIANSVVLICAVTIIAAVIAIPAAWLIARCEFVGRRVFQWALLLPLAMPAYILAYVYTDLLDYAGPVQIALRDWFGWQSQSDYYFPEVRSLYGASLMLALVLFPYIYLLARTAFSEQNASLMQASRIMGATSWQSFRRVSLPLARPAIAAGMALVAMETAADFATVNYFAVPTLTTAIYDTWLEYGSLNAAAKLSTIMLLVIFCLVSLEAYARRRQRLYYSGLSGEPLPDYQLSGTKAVLAFSYCALLLILAFIIPCMVLMDYAIDYFAQSWQQDFWLLGFNSFLVAVLVAVLTCFAALLLMFIGRVSPRQVDSWLPRLAGTGYAIPGTVLAIGCLVPFGYADFAINDLAVLIGFKQPGLLLSGSLAALIFAFCVRFMAIALGGLDSSYKRLSTSLDMAVMTMDKRASRLLVQVHFPLLKRGLLTGFLLVFVESMKELPAALLLKPIGFENLATHVYQFVSDEQLEHGALAAMAIVVIGLIPLIYINRSLELKS